MNNLATTVQNQVWVKFCGLESKYNLRTPASKANDQSRIQLMVMGGGFWYCIRLHMVNMLGEAPAKRAIAKHSGLAKLLGGKSQTILGDYFPSTKKAKK